jgi:hypothetical protein
VTSSVLVDRPSLCRSLGQDGGTAEKFQSNSGMLWDSESSSMFQSPKETLGLSDPNRKSPRVLRSSTGSSYGVAVGYRRDDTNTDTSTGIACASRSLAALRIL